MSHHWVLVVVWVKIDSKWVLIYFWICLSHWHIFVEAAAANGVNFLPVSAFTVGERHVYPLTDKVTGVRVPDAVRCEAAGGKKAPAVVFGGRCDWNPADLLEARRNFNKIMWKPSAMGSFLLMLVISSFPQNYGRPVAGGATQFAATHAKASYLELVPGYGRSGEKTINDGVLRRDLAQFLAALDDQDRKLTHIDVIDSAIEYQPDLYTLGESVEAKVDFADHVIKWNRDASIERADEVNAGAVTRLSRLASEKPRTIVFAAPVLKYAADIHLLHALGGKTKANDFAVVDKLPKNGKLGPGGVHQVAVRTRTGGTASAPQYTYQLHTYQKKKYWKPNTSPPKALSITFELLDKLLKSGHLPEGALPASFRSVECLHAIDATRVHLTMKWVVYFSILRPSGPTRCVVGALRVLEAPRSPTCGASMRGPTVPRGLGGAVTPVPERLDLRDAERRPRPRRASTQLGGAARPTCGASMAWPHGSAGSRRRGDARARATGPSRRGATPSTRRVVP